MSVKCLWFIDGSSRNEGGAFGALASFARQAPASPVISGNPYQGQVLSSTANGEWLINGVPTGVVGDTFTVPETVLMGDEITQAGSNVLTVIRIPLALGIKVDTELTGVTGSDGFRLPARNDTGYDCRVYWGDGTYSDIDAYNHPDLEHTYPTEGIYDIQISGTFRGFFFNNAGDKDKLLRIDQWGETGQATVQDYAFYGCVNLTTLPDDMTLLNLTDGSFMFVNTSITTLPDGMTLPSLTNGFAMFWGCVNLTTLPDGMTLPSLTNGQSMFNNTSITTLPDDMTLPSLTNGNFMFVNTTITTLPDDMTLPALNNGQDMFYGTTITTTRYSQLLIDLAEHNPNSNVTFHGGNSKYNPAGAIARSALVARGWTITDGGPE